MGAARKVLNWYAKLAPARGRATPPYSHVVQIGDPRLRKASEPVPLDLIKTDQIQKVLEKLHFVLSTYDGVGMSAPQIGVNLRIFAMSLTPKQVASYPKDEAKSRGIEVVPYTVFINPKMKVLDYRKVIHSEGCESVRGFAADVPRYKEVELTGLNGDGEEIKKSYKNWTARIVQHELDHLDGKLYTDLMDRRTLHCTCWEEVNLSQGRVSMPFRPE